MASGPIINVLYSTTTLIFVPFLQCVRQAPSRVATDAAYLASSCDIMAPVVGSTAVAPLTNGVWRTDTLSCVSITVIPHMTALTGCRRAGEMKESTS